MDVPPEFDLPQVQTILNALKNICRDYPAGGSVIRELLQNADDASATEVKFFLDEKGYATENLSPELAQYQGPALLAYNNAEFKEEHFRSLSQVGNSLKIEDVSTTGKFGRGFNSVYNWTDSPSIVSGHRVQILDPHHAWSNGGNGYDFVKYSENPQIKAHMAVYQSVFKDLDQYLDRPFPGTIIRIPLRTADQARHSGISDRKISASEMAQVLETFTESFSTDGLLFMKHVLKINVVSTSTGVIEIEVVNPEAVQLNKDKVNDAIISSLDYPDQAFDCTFEIEVRYKIKQNTTTKRFLLHHSIQRCLMTDEIRKWSETQKLVPWVAVAIPLVVENGPVIHGSLFLVMPLHIPINQPALIHGLFGISPDRARLYKSQDFSSQDKLPAKWNQWLFDSSIPHAWMKLLSYLVVSFPPDLSFKYWPIKSDDPDNLSKDVLTQVLAMVGDRRLPLWYTADGYVSADCGLLANGNEPEPLKLALADAKIPVIYLPDRLRGEAKQIFSDLNLEPRTLCKFLSDKDDLVASWSKATRQQILEYLLPILVSSEYGKDLVLFPFEDGQCRSIDVHLTFVHRDDFEAELFQHDPQHNLNLAMFSRPSLETLQALLKPSQLPHNVRHRSASDISKYAMVYFFAKIDTDADLVALDPDQISFVARIWTWIQRNSNFLDDSIANLWLFPVTNGNYRKVKPRSCWAIIPPAGPLSSIVQKLGEDVSIGSCPVILSGVAGLSSTLLAPLKSTEAGAALQLFHGDLFHILLQWFGESNLTIANSPDEDKTVIVENLARGLEKQLELKHTIDNLLNLRTLPIFRELTWRKDGDNWFPGVAWARMETSKSKIGVIDGIMPLPTFKCFQFFDAQTTSIQNILRYQQLGVCKSKVKVLEDHIIPAWKGHQTCTWPASSKAQTAETMLQSYNLLSAQAQAAMIDLPIVSTQCIDGTLTDNFSTAAVLIDPENKWLKSVFFGDEAVLPTKEQYFRYGPILKKFGLRTDINELFIYDRVREFANGSRSTDEIQNCALNMLKSSCSWYSPKGPAIKPKQFLNLKWVPATLPDGTIAMTSPDQCRGMEDRLRVGYILPIVSVDVSRHWREFLGWNKILSDDVLLAQLKQGITKEDGAVVNSVLAYIKENCRIDAVSELLKALRCVLTDRGMFVTASKAFISGCTHLHPFLGNIDAGFATKHKDILKAMNVRFEPGVKDILAIQAQIEQSGHPYKDSDIKVLLEIITIASRSSRTTLRGLKVLDQDSVLCPIEDIAYNDASLLSDRIVNKVRFTNSRVSKELAYRLSIELISDRLKKGELELADDDDDEEEFRQCEAITTSISTTLDRYPIDSTFKEYLANADDAKASAVHWLLDPRQHPTDNLLTEEMQDLQGPALLVHNDAAFRDIDFRGFKDVGLGSKREDKSTIGMFGRGSQTMFHFTDNPCLLSGDYLLILDPLQKCLPLNSNFQARKPGVKILLSKIKHLHPNQLVPLQGLWGYDTESDHYDGTIFRFPLRKHASPLREKQERPSIDSVRLLLNLYFKEARISLLFLKGVKVIAFKGPGIEELFWSVNKRRSTSDYTLVSAKQMVNSKLVVTEDRWWVYSRTEDTPSGEYQSRFRKNLNYGIAALVSSGDKQGEDIQDTFTPRIFSTLPIPEASNPSNLPVHIHATFSLDGDRGALITEGESSKAGGSNWNAWLLEDKLAAAYLVFLEGLTQEIGSDAFRYWPHRDPPEGSRLKLLCKSFWEKIPFSSARLFPRSVANLDATIMTISEAVFDVLVLNLSQKIAPVLQALIRNLSSRLPPHILVNIESMNFPGSINCSNLRRILESKRASELLQKAMIDDSSLISRVLHEVIPTGDVSTDELKQLDGCRVLPLEDGTLGQVTWTQSPMPPGTRIYYIVTKSEYKIFEFAKSLLILKPQSDTYDRIAELVKREKFNVVNLEFSHVPELLSKKLQGSKVENEDTDKWLKSFWTYWNQNPSSSTEKSFQDPKTFRSLPLLKAKCNGVSGYYTMSELRELPAIIDPAEQDHKDLCSCVPGLYVFKPEFMPKIIADREKSLKNVKAFGRFIDALRILCPDSALLLELFTQLITQQSVKESGRKDIIKLLRELAIDHVINGHNAALEYLMLLPIWPAYMPSSRSEKYISASGAMYTKNPQLLAPWTKILPKIIDFKVIESSRAETCLEQLEVKKLSPTQLIQMFDHQDFPATLQSVKQSVYMQFLDTLSGIVSIEGHDSSLLRLLPSLAFAADTSGTMHRPSALFDHSDEIFKAAFQDSHGHFLHDCVQKMENVAPWFKIGLRRRESNGCLRIHDYIECLGSLEILLQTNDHGILMQPNTYGRVNKILSPLTTPSSATHLFNANDWRDIATYSAFLVRTIHSREPSYRREVMNIISQGYKAISLAEVVLHKHAAICWSNTPFVTMEPTSEVLSKVSTRGEPSMAEVWKHLEHMMKISQTILRADIPDFLSDLYEIYDFLQNNLERSKEYFKSYASTLNQMNLWLNMDIPDPSLLDHDAFQTSWRKLEHLLLLSSTDAPPQWCIRQSLSPYQKLLKELGCKSIRHRRHVQLSAPQASQSLLTTLRTFQKEKKMTDAIFVAEGIRFHVHKVVMASKSEYCALHFSGRWSIGGEILLDEMTSHSLRIIIAAAYEESIDWTDMIPEDSHDPEVNDKNDTKLDILLDLHKGADYLRMTSLASEVEEKIVQSADLFVRLDNVKEYEAIAADSAARAFEELCREFREDNKATYEGWKKAYTEALAESQNMEG